MDLTRAHRVTLPTLPGIRVSRKTSVAVFFVGALALVFLSFAKPYHNWDMIAYTAAVLSDDGRTAEDLHRETWALVASHVSDKDFAALSTGAGTKHRSYRIEQYTNAEAFVSMLPMYEVKVGYIALLKALSAVLDPIQSMMLVSAASAIGLTFIMFWASRSADGAMTLAWLPVVGVLGIIPLARYSTPDGLATCLYAGGIFFLLRRRPTATVIFLLLGLAVRPDNVILNLALAAVAAAISWRGSAVLALGSGAIYLGASAWSDHIGWWSHFYFSLIELRPTLVGFDPNFDLLLYIETLGRFTAKLLLKDWFILPLGELLILAVLLPGAKDRFAGRVVLALAGSLMARFVIFPITEGRIYSPHLFGLAIVILHLLGTWAPNPRRAENGVSAPAAFSP